MLDNLEIVHKHVQFEIKVQFFLKKINCTNLQKYCVIEKLALLKCEIINL